MNIHDLPQRLHIDHLEANEHVVMFLRRHIIVFWKKAVFFIAFALAPVIIWIVLYTRTDMLENPQNAIRIILILAGSLFYLFWLRNFFTTWIDYYLDVWIVTNIRIMNIEHKGLFHRKVSEQRLDRVQDVTTESRGFLQTTLNFGDIHVQTAAESEHFIFRDITNPEEVARGISELQTAALAQSSGQYPSQPPIESSSPITETLTKDGQPRSQR